MRLSTRILLGYFLVIGLLAAFVLKVVVDHIKPSVSESIEEVMVDTAHVLAQLAAKDMADLEGSPFTQAMNRFSNQTVNANIWHFKKTTLDFDIYLTDQAGIVIFDSQGKAKGQNFSNWRNIRLTLKGQYGARSSTQIDSQTDNAVFHVSAPIYSLENPKQLIGTLTLAKSMDSLQPIIEKAQTSITKQTLVLLLFATFIGAVLTWRFNRSIARLVSYAQTASSTVTATPPKMHTREFAQLASAMSDMRAELAGKRQVEQYAQGLAHELKSPLSAVAASAELLSDVSLAAVDRQRLAQIHTEQVSKMTQAIDTMLAAARLENHVPQRATVELNQLVEAVVAEYAVRHQAKKINVLFNQTELVVIQADESMVKLALSNLLANAIQFSNAGQHISITLRKTTTVKITVTDQGPGIAQYALPKVLERFYALPRPNGEKGSGLGLSIVQFVAKAHGGNIQLTNLHPGLQAVLTLQL